MCVCLKCTQLRHTLIIWPVSFVFLLMVEVNCCLCEAEVATLQMWFTHPWIKTSNLSVSEQGLRTWPVQTGLTCNAKHGALQSGHSWEQHKLTRPDCDDWYPLLFFDGMQFFFCTVLRDTTSIMRRINNTWGRLITKQQNPAIWPTNHHSSPFPPSLFPSQQFALPHWVGP